MEIYWKIQNWVIRVMVLNLNINFFVIICKIDKNIPIFISFFDIGICQLAKIYRY